MHYGSRVTEAFWGDFAAFFTKKAFFFRNDKGVTPSNKGGVYL